MNLGITNCEDGNWNSVASEDQADVNGTGTWNCVSPGTAHKFFNSKKAMAQAHTVAYCCTNTRWCLRHSCTVAFHCGTRVPWHFTATTPIKNQLVCILYSYFGLYLVLWCVTCTVVVETCFVMCECFCNTCTCISCLVLLVLFLYCFVYVYLLLVVLSVLVWGLTTATEWQLSVLV
jgi:hypothetical protein